MSDLQYASLSNGYDVQLPRFSGIKSDLDSIQYIPVESLALLYDFHSILTERAPVRLDCNTPEARFRLALDHLTRAIQYESRPVRYYTHSVLPRFRHRFIQSLRTMEYELLPIRFTSRLAPNITQWSGSWNAKCLQILALKNSWDSLGSWLYVLCPNRLDCFRYYYEIANARHHAHTDYTCPRVSGITSFHDTYLAYYDRYSSQFSLATNDYLFAKVPNRYDQFVYQPAQWPLAWTIIPSEFLAKEWIRFDAEKGGRTSWPLHWQALVQPGWQILARSRSTGITQRLGFIDATESRSLPDIALPDDDYEFSVLTSSYFWQETQDRNLLAISLKPGEKLSPLPLVYHLRSTITGGTTSILWSAQTTEITDSTPTPEITDLTLTSEITNFVFGIWYSPNSPVDINRAPDATVWYSPDMTEYQTSLAQTEPQYVAIASMRTGNTPETSPAVELYLDWNNTPPTAPENVVPLNQPFSVPEDIHPQENYPSL